MACGLNILPMPPLGEAGGPMRRHFGSDLAVLGARKHTRAQRPAAGFAPTSTPLITAAPVGLQHEPRHEPRQNSRAG